MKNKVKLIPWEKGEGEILADLFNHTERKYMSGRRPTPYPVEDAENWILDTLEKDGKDGVYRAVVVEGVYVGVVMVDIMPDLHCKDADIGYLIIKDAWNQGIGTEAVRQITEEAFKQLPITRLTAYVFGENIASKCLLEKNGYVLEGVLKNSIFKDGKVDDDCIYGKYRE